jgi:hypothetical protein
MPLLIVPGVTRFGRWLAVKDLGCVRKQRWWLLRCDCGTEKRVRVTSLRSGCSKSCGCLSKELTAGRCLTHGASAGQSRGESLAPEYRSWRSMRTRCLNTRSQYYASYGGRGVRICERWQGEDGFANFLADMGKKPTPKHSIDRIDNDGNYEPGNCRWATKRQQVNNRRATRFVECRNRRLLVSEWARETGLSPECIRARLRSGWPAERAVSTPLRGRN